MRRLRRAAVAMLAVLAILLSSCTGTGPARGHSASPATAPRSATPSTTTTTTPPPTGTPPPVPLVEDLTWVSNSHGWALVDQPKCGQPTCLKVLTTTDGGTTWSQIGSIATTASECAGCGGPSVSSIRFANDLDGYAFGPALFVTTDGGVTWTWQDGPFVAALEPAGSNVMRIAYTQTGCPGPCDLTIQSAPAGGTAWTTLHAPIQGDAVQLVRQGTADAYVATFENPAGGAQDEHGTLTISRNGGTTWSTRPDPCGEVDGAEYDTAAIAAASPSVLAVLCRDRMQPQNMSLALSSDGGTSFTMGPLIPGAPLAAVDQLAATSASAVFLGFSTPVGTGTTQYSLLASDDGGRSWYQSTSETGEEVGTSPPPGTFLGFESAAVGRWVVAGNDLWQTTDGGAQWVQEPALP
jgi:photosystem II stability/assembly factor-like uncharacterized protein